MMLPLQNRLSSCYHLVMKIFPDLDFSNRSREFNCYSEKQRSAVIYHWLVTGMTTREMDKEILGMDARSKGYQSHGIYRYLGLTGEHQGFLKAGSSLISLHTFIGYVEIQIIVSFSITFLTISIRGTFLK